MKTKLLITLIALASNVFAQDDLVKDSLIEVANKTTNIRDKFELYFSITQHTASENVEEFDKWADKTWELVDELNNDTLRAQMHIMVGSAFRDKGDNQSKLNHLFEAVKITEKNKDSIRLARAFYAIGGYYFWKQKPEEAFEYIEKAMNAYPDSGNPLRKATYTMAYGVVLQQYKPKEAVKYHEEALKIKRKAKAFKEIPISLNNLAELKVDLGDTVRAIELLEESIHISAKYNIKDAEVYADFVLGDIYNKQGKYALALPLISKSVQWWEDNEYLKDLPRAYKALANAFSGVGDHRGSTKAWKKYVALSEKLFEQDQLNAVQELETKYQTEKKEIALAKEKQEKELAKKETELIKANERTRLILFSIIGVLLIGGGLYVYTLYRKQKKDKVIISNQKVQLEVRNKEVEDSIVYAKRIQNAILPRERLLNKNLPEHFVLYKPKDIIAGDFYWMHEIEGKSDKVSKEGGKSNGVLLAAADCTGHGVPGAMVSVVCNNGLNRSVREFGLSEPGKILDKTRELVIQEFEKSEDDVKDGMDIALVALAQSELESVPIAIGSEDLRSHTSHLLSYSGAHNPLWIIRKDSEEIEEIKAEKQPIGRYDEIRPYKTHKMELKKGDQFYIFSDGFADQFGGEKGKKMKAANFKKLLISMSNETMKKQKELLEDAFNTWKGDLEQLDDVCVIGVRL